MPLNSAFPARWVQKLTRYKVLNSSIDDNKINIWDCKGTEYLFILNPSILSCSESSTLCLKTFCLAEYSCPAISWLIVPFAGLQKWSNYSHHYFKPTQDTALLSVWKTSLFPHGADRFSDWMRSCPLARPEVLVCPETKLLKMRMETGLVANHNHRLSPSEKSLTISLSPHHTSIVTTSTPDPQAVPSWVHICSFQKVPNAFVNTHAYLFFETQICLRQICRHSVSIKVTPGRSSKWKGDK